VRWLSDDDVALFTDLYELTMAASYAAHGLDHEATFDLFVRHLPEQRRFLVACGVDDAIDYLTGLHVPGPCVDYLSTLGLFDDGFLDHLAGLQFTGDVWALPEGEVFFANEPVLEVTAPLIEAQIVETFLINCVAAQTMIASKAARVAIACGERAFVDFAARRDHGADAALKGARASVIGGAMATSLVVAGMAYGLPLNGTMAHSYVMSFDDERDAFRAYARDFPRDAVFLIDTYDTLQGARAAAEVANELRAEGVQLRGVRLDSGDLGSLARGVRDVLDEAGCSDVQIFASGDLDELRITEVLGAGAPVDGFGVGTQLGTSADAPALAGVYKLVEDVHGPKIKLAEGKVTLPGRKQVHRFAEHDLVAGRDEVGATGGRPLLEPAVVAGRRVRAAASISDARERRATAVAALPSRLRTLSGREAPYEVRISDGLQALSAELIEQHGG
jgi:nicotinate phosphoribosyltransferase